MSTLTSLVRRPWLPLAGLVVALAAAIAVFVLAQAERDANRWIARTIDTKIAIVELDNHIVRYESAGRGYLNKPLPALLADMDAARGDVDRQLDRLAGLTAADPVQRAHVARLRPLVVQRMAFMTRFVEYQREGRLQFAFATVSARPALVLARALRAETTAMTAEEDRVLARRQAKVRRLSLLVSSGLALAIVVVTLAAILMVRDADLRFRAMTEARDDARAAAERLKLEQDARGRAEGQLRQVQRMETIGQLSGGIAHDFNNMLAIIVGNIDLAARRLDDPARAAKSLGHAREGAERATALTARLLAFARRQPLAPVAIDGNRLIAGMAELLGRSLGEEITIEIVQAAGLWTSYADAGQLENAILNLAVNARDAMVGDSRGKLTIELANIYLDEAYARAHAEVTPGQYVVFAATDTGHGMDATALERAFEPFFTTKEVGRGTGLGLSQVFGFAKQSGGHVAIYSEVGEGTTVKLYLPRHHGAPVPLPAREDDAALPRARAGETILVVEDEEKVRRLSEEALRELGYDVVSAEDGRRALGLLAEGGAVTLLFTDVVMPGLNGRELAERARALRPRLPVLYTTGYTRNAVVHNGVLDPGVALLPKPFTLADLARKVREVLDGAAV